MKNPRPAPPEICPVCGEDVPRNALACPACGADHRSGWREEADSIDALGGVDFSDGEDLPDFAAAPPRTAIKVIWWIAGVLLLLALGWQLAHGGF